MTSGQSAGFCWIFLLNAVFLYEPNHFLGRPANFRISFCSLVWTSDFSCPSTHHGFSQAVTPFKVVFKSSFWIFGIPTWLQSTLRGQDPDNYLKRLFSGPCCGPKGPDSKTCKPASLDQVKEEFGFANLSSGEGIFTRETQVTAYSNCW